jgi:hypothetical protein
LEVNSPIQNFNYAENLYLAVFYTPTDQYSKEERLKIENELINFYEPVCNEKK